MKRTCIVVLLLLVITASRAQNIGIGTTQPDNSAALDISSSNKGLLIPRVNLANGIGTPATGLMVFNTNAGYSGGTGLYINTGTTAAPQWVQLVANTSGSFIRNDARPQANSNFNISGTGTIGTALKVGGPAPVPLVLTSSSTGSTSIYLSNASHPNASWQLITSGSSSAVPGSFSLYNTISHVTGLTIASNGAVAIGRNIAPTAALDVNGDIKASGDVIIDIKYVSEEYTIHGHSASSHYISCPAGYRLLTGGGGHRDYNTAIQDIQIAYNGPDPGQPSTIWRIFASNNSGSNRAMIINCNCAKIR